MSAPHSPKGSPGSTCSTRGRPRWRSVGRRAASSRRTEPGSRSFRSSATSTIPWPTRSPRPSSSLQRTAAPGRCSHAPGSTTTRWTPCRSHAGRARASRAWSSRSPGTGVDGTYRALWRTQFDLDALRPTPDLPLAIAAVPPAPKTPPVDLEARRAWDRSYRRYREQARTARSIWVTSAVVGGLATLATITAIDGAVSADDPDQRAEARRMALVYGGVTAASVGVTVTLGMVEKRANERARALGRRP